MLLKISFQRDSGVEDNVQPNNNNAAQNNQNLGAEIRNVVANVADALENLAEQIWDEIDAPEADQEDNRHFDEVLI